MEAQHRLDDDWWRDSIKFVGGWLLGVLVAIVLLILAKPMFA